MAYHGRMQAITLLGNWPQVLQNVWHFEILTLESMGKHKMWNISKTSDRRAKRTKFGMTVILKKALYTVIN